MHWGTNWGEGRSSFVPRAFRFLFSLPIMLRVYVRHNRQLLKKLCLIDNEFLLGFLRWRLNPPRRTPRLGRGKVRVSLRKPESGPRNGLTQARGASRPGTLLRVPFSLGAGPDKPRIPGPRP